MVREGGGGEATGKDRKGRGDGDGNRIGNGDGNGNGSKATRSEGRKANLDGLWFVRKIQERWKIMHENAAPGVVVGVGFGVEVGRDKDGKRRGPASGGNWEAGLWGWWDWLCGAGGRVLAMLYGSSKARENPDGRSNLGSWMQGSVL